MHDVYIIGAGQLPVSKNQAQSTRELAVKAVAAALADAEVDRDAVGALYVGNMLAGTTSRQQQLGSLLAHDAGLPGIEAITVEAACASGGAAARMAYQAIAGGQHSVVVVCGVERMSHVDHTSITNALASAADWELEGRHGASFLSLNATLMSEYMRRYGVDGDAFAPFAISAHANATTNPHSLFHRHIDIAAYRASRMIVEPIRLYDAAPICDGAAALVLAGPDIGLSSSRGAAMMRVRISGSAAATTVPALMRRHDILELEAVRITTDRALQQAGIDRRDLSAVELHDAYTIMAALSLEASGFAAPGQAPRLAAEGYFERAGPLPVATCGGLKGRGHPVGATGVYQLVEAYAQLTGRAGANQLDDPEHILVQNIGGTGATVVTHVLSRAA